MTLEVQITHRAGDFSLDTRFIADEGITALFGRSGAGKTTVINAVAGLLQPDAGRIAVHGEVMFDSKNAVFVPPAKRRLGYVFQDARLFPHLSVRENLQFGARYSPADAKGPDQDSVCTLLGLTPLLDRAPATLSGGEKQRVALGRALLSKPRMLLMDEPLASLDGARKQEILPYLERLRDGPLRLPILYVSHAVDEVARLADTLVLLEAGRVQKAGPLMDVMADPAAVPLLGVREAGAVIEATVMAHADDGLTRLKFSGGDLHLPGVQAEVGAKVRLRVLAQDVLVSRDRPVGLSALNILPVTVQAVHLGNGPGAAVVLQAGKDQLLSRITTRAVKELELEPGQPCFAVIKATSVAPISIGR
ncbi:Molybdenum transport ATP-binding protein ModC [Sulfitobacter noctilucicola]|uniref:Molybdate transport system ATP-binding protein n=1 Tax=Sulfitobacter noctilucicola TaxID=1342301 RepID=A0A7W6M8Y3_9RHOB|nr:molybdenum ABC transporter ATP-binding protein [Sulfitobacter noctilucicola]KIN63859.1 Molybdenum transport ATP-binding protein ModC [Sulfitobacter noctilucicola]MBB4174634.1 molybdate transport system ATP-binding protein [Sulfitobacter noctilucicola]